MKLKTPMKAAIAIGAGAILAIAIPLSASAHVTISPNTAPAGTYALITFKAPNESATAVTNKLEVDLPTDTPFSSVSYVPVQGWNVTLVTTTLPKPVKIEGNELKQAVTKVIWTADPGSEIQAGQIQLFPLSLGAVPDTGKLVFKALQTYSDGSVVKWVETTADADHPAPVLYINEAPPATTTTSTAGPSISVSTPLQAANSSDVLARGLGIGGLVVGAIGLVVALVATRRRGTDGR